MTPLPVIDGVFRISLLWTPAHGVNPVNVFHVGAPLLNELEVAGIINDNINSDMFECVSEDYSLDTMDVLPLDGETPTLHYTLTPGVDGRSGGGAVPEAAGVVSFRTARRGPRGRGRVFLGPLGEEAINDGLIGGDSLTAPPAAWETFAAGMISDGVGLVVASYVHADFHQVTGYSMSANYGTQRRRLTRQRA